MTPRRTVVIETEAGRQAFRRAVVMTVAFLLAGLPASLFAQQPAAPGSSTTTVVTPSRPLYFEAAIVIVMVGLALFAVCRSSRRN